MNPAPPDPIAQRQHLLQAGLDLIDQGFTVFDAQLRLVAWNRAFLRLLGFPGAMARVGAPFEDFVRHNARRGEYGEGEVEALVAARVAEARRFEPHDFERVRADGRILRVHGQPLPGLGFVTLYEDITARRSAEDSAREQTAELERRVEERTQELRRSEQQMRLVTDSIPALVGYSDRGGRYRYVNRGYRDWFGLDPREPGAISAREFLGERTYLSIRPHVLRAKAGESVTFDYEITRIDGSTVRVRTSLIPDIGADGVVAGCFELTFDMTEQWRTQEVLMRAQKMEALGQLTGGLAHDFNNLLTVIIGNLGMLAEARAEEPETREYVEPALKAARRGADLIRGLLGFARQQPLKSGTVDVTQVLGGVARLLRRSLPETLGIEVTVPAQPLWAWIDAPELENALINLLLNSRDATGGQGELRLRAAAAPLAAQAAQALSIPAGDYIRIDVQDDGCGMDEATLARVFEPFFTTKPVGAGSGLGMAMVYGFVRQSGGAIDIASRPGAGTTVSLWLPVSDAPDATPDEAPPPQARRPGTLGLALLVEDDAGVRQVVRRSLLELGYAVLEAENGVEGREILAATPGIVLLVTDAVMPGGVDGRDLAREARDVHGIARVVLMSGHAPARAEPGGLPLLAKPFSPAQLAAAIGEAGT